MNTRLKLTLFSGIMATTLPFYALADSPVDAAPMPEHAAELDAHIRTYLMDNPEVIIEALQVLKSREAERAAASDLELIDALSEALFAIGPGSSVVGNPDGTRTLVEFVDYQCGYCKQMHATTAAMLEADPELRIIYKEFPILGPQSLLASKLLIAVTRDLGPEYYQPLSDALFAMRGSITAESISSILDTPSVTSEQKTALLAYLTAEFDAIQSDPTLNEALEANNHLAEALGITGTPGFVGPSGIIRGAAGPERLSAIAAPQE